MIFLDASVLLAAEDSEDPNHPAAKALLRTGALGTLDLAVYELTNVAEVRWRDPQAGARLRERVWAIAELGVLVRVNRALAERTSELSRQHDISAYDAAYVAGAEQIGAPLASCDKRDLVSQGLAKLPGQLLGSLAKPCLSHCRASLRLVIMDAVSHDHVQVAAPAGCEREGGPTVSCGVYAKSRNRRGWVTRAACGSPSMHPIGADPPRGGSLHAKAETGEVSRTTLEIAPVLRLTSRQTARRSQPLSGRSGAWLCGKSAMQLVAGVDFELAEDLA